MGKLFVVALIALAGYLCFKSNLFVSAAPVAIEGGEIRVGVPDGDWARFSVGQSIQVEATAVHYEFNSFGSGGDAISSIGGRAQLSYMGTFQYDQMLAIQGNRHDALETYLAQAESSGVLRRVVLIPRSSNALSQIRSASLDEGSRFHLTGQIIQFRDAVVDHRPADPATFSGNTYFLVETLSLD